LSSSPSPKKKRKKTPVIKLDEKFDLPIYDGELNAEKQITRLDRLMYISGCGTLI